MPAPTCFLRLVAAWREDPLDAFGFLMAFYIILIGGLLGIMALFGAARRMGDKISRGLLGFSVLALLGFGLFQLWRAVFA